MRQHQGDGWGPLSVEQLGEAFVAGLAQEIEGRRGAFGRHRLLGRGGPAVLYRPVVHRRERRLRLFCRPLQAAGLKPV